MMHEMRIIVSGERPADETVEWDPDDSNAVAAAYRRYERLKRDGFSFYDAVERRQLTRFDKRHTRILAVEAT